MPLSAAERQRRCRLKKKQDQAKYEEYLAKARERYHKNKKLVRDMDQREKRLANRKWRVKQKKRRDKEKEEDKALRADTPPPTPPSTPNSVGRKKIRRDRSKLYRENLKLQIESDKWKRKYERYKKKLQRLQSKHDEYSVLCDSIKDNFQSIRSRKDRKLLKEAIVTQKVKDAGLENEIRRNTLGIRHKKNQKIVTNKARSLRQKIVDFYVRDDNSRATAGKNETITKNKIKKQRRYLLDTVKNLHRDFKKECDIPCSLAYFAKMRPFFVMFPKADSRETCLCKKHINMQYKATALRKKRALNTDNTNNLIKMKVCNINKKECMEGTCEDCRMKNVINLENLRTDEEVYWPEWIRKTEEITVKNKTKKVTKNVKKLQIAKLSELIKTFEKDFEDFKKHVFNIRKQQKAYRDCIDNLTPNSVAIHMDFSENYCCKHSEEIQAHHFGGSRNQLSLHTVVLYVKPEDVQKNIKVSFCTVSSSLSHGPSAIWAHIHPILEYIKEKYSTVSTIHFFSDGPCTQYRQKQNFYLMTTRFFDYGFKNMTWTFFEAGHGKGAADGIGGLVKRTADRLVAHRHDIVDLTQFYDLLKDATAVKFYVISQSEIDQVSITIPANLQTITGTMRLHHIFSNSKGLMTYSDLSCFCKNSEVPGFCSCLNKKTHRFLNDEDDTDSDIEIAKEDSRYYHTDKEDEIATNTEKYSGSAIIEVSSGRKGDIFSRVYENLSDSDDEPLEVIRKKKLCINDSAIVGTSLDETIIHPRNLPIGSYVLIKIISEKKNITYNYVGVIDSTFDEDEAKVIFLKCTNETKTLFRFGYNDIAFVHLDQIVRVLEKPAIKMRGSRILYEFSSTIEEVFEQ